MSAEHLISLSFAADLSFEQVSLFVGALDDIALSSSFRQDQTDDSWHCLWTIEEKADTADIQARLMIAADIHELPVINLSTLNIEPLPDTNWLAASYAGFQPFTLGPFFVYGSHHRDDVTVPPGAMTLEIDAATAFGSGEHGTTAGCMLALEKLHAENFTPRTFLDMGTGSGILAIATAKRWPSVTGLAVDNDPECIVVTDRHRESNHINAAQVQSFVSEGFADPRVQKDAPYDLVIANILALPLIGMAADLSKATAKDGYLILSGLLITQKDDVFAAYQAQGMEMVDAATRDEWSILTLKHAA